MDLYQANILDHYKHPRHHGRLENAMVSSEQANPLCGDRIAIELKLENAKIADAKFTGEGCVLSQAAASILLDELVGTSVDDVKKWPAQKIMDLLKITVGPNRQKCALLSLASVQAALKKTK